MLLSAFFVGLLMNASFDWKSAVLKATNAVDAHRQERIQSLWSGYGEIVRIRLVGSEINTVVLKSIELPEKTRHPRGWNTDLSHQRKVRSYEVERNWYERYANLCDDACRVPRCYGTYESGQKQWIVLEDLDASGFAGRHQALSVNDAKLCLRWLAVFHAKFLSHAGDGLWEQGTYWHLQTRPDELAAMTDSRLQAAAGDLDAALASCQYQTIVHGDAKLANFCFSGNLQKVSAVDFQYVGRGCGMKDVAYFLGSCLDEDDCERFESELLAAYFDALGEAMVTYDVALDFTELKAQWTALYAVAWTDFYRFLQGWSPSHSKINAYTKILCQKALMSF